MTSPATGKRVALAAVAGAHGVKGELRLKLFSDGVESLARHSRLFVGGRELPLKDIKDGGKTAIARFEGISDRSAAEALRGQLVEIDRDQLPSLEEGEYYHADLIGLPVVTPDGDSAGIVTAVENFGAGDVLDIEKPDGKSFMAPMHAVTVEPGRLVIDPVFIT